MKQKDKGAVTKSTEGKSGATTANDQMSSKPRRLSDRQLEAAYAIGGDWAIRSASKASFRAKPFTQPRTDKDKQRLIRWILLQKFFGSYAAVQIAAANDLLKGPVKADLEVGVAAANKLEFDHNVLLKDAVKLVKGRWWLVEYVVESVKASPKLWTDPELSRLRIEVRWT